MSQAVVDSFKPALAELEKQEKGIERSRTKIARNTERTIKQRRNALAKQTLKRLGLSNKK